ncbi:MAG TPA: ABC transporter ATP-binding protein [Myxococcota bacterium]|nr:ABC transporter ATP-binding protein [Myxococcota bacterium]
METLYARAPMIAFELAGVSKLYGGRRALDRVNLAVPMGTAVGLLGPNGAGKTTALRLLLGFVRPSVGGVRLRGLSPADPRSRESLGYVPERPAFPPRMMIRELLRLHGGLIGLDGDALEHEIDARLVETGLRERAHERVGGMSKGLMQRVAFAQALLGDPELLLLDEPTSGLDPLGVRDARDWILAARQRGRTLLVSSHVLTEVERTCDHVVILHEGRIAASGPLAEVVLGGESLEDAYVRIVRGEGVARPASPGVRAPEGAE